jgi:uncharacterized SAM-binding protein YcdF (DUF218 family)
MKATFRWLKRGVCLAVLAGILVVWLAPVWVLPPVARFLDVSEPPQPVDYVLVLNGGPNTRPFAAAALVRAGLARTILLTRPSLALESASVQEGVTLPELEITKRVLKGRDIAEERVRILPGEVTSTADEASELAAFLETEPGATAAVVTNSFHTRRAQMVFARALGANAGRVSFVGVPQDDLDEDSWWRSPQGCTTYVSEYCKLPYYWLRY